MNGEFVESTKKILAKRAGEKCSICHVSTSKPSQGNAREFINLGEAGHINGNRLGTHTRYVETMTDEERSDISNGIWLCRSCHKEIDSDSNKYTSTYLIELKKVHENKVYLGTFDIQWKEKEFFEKRITDLAAIISEKEKNETLQETIHNGELNKIRIELETIKLDKEKLQQSIVRFTDILAGLDFSDSNENTASLIEHFKAGNLEKLKELLSEEKFEFQEIELARKRLLRANLSENDNDYFNAELDYKRAFDLSPNLEFLESYIGFLTRISKYDRAIEIGKNSLGILTDSDSNIWLNGAIGELYCRNHKNGSAINHFIDALKTIDSIMDANPQRYKLRKAQMLSALGTARRNVGDFEHALTDYELALNLFWEMTTKDGVTHVEELGNLFNGIGRLYLENNNPQESLSYYSKAEKAFNETGKDINLSALYLNKVDALIHPKIFDLKEARRYLDLVKGILQKCFKDRPLSNLEFYLGAITKSADNLLMTGNLQGAENEYLGGMSICEEFKNNHGIPNTETLAVIYSNYAVLLATLKRKDDALNFINKSIDLLMQFDDSEHKKHLSLSRSYLFKSELIDNKEKQIELIRRADNHIDRCSDKAAIKDLKIFVNRRLVDLETKG